MASQRTKRRLSACLFALVMLASLAGACQRLGGPKPAMSDAELQSAASSALSGFLNSAHLDDRETVFAVQVAASGSKITLAGKSSDPAQKQALLDKMAQIPGASVVDQIVSLPSADLGEKTYGIVKVSVLNLGDGPKSAGGSHTVTQARMGEVLALLEQKDGWYLARMEDGYLGWVDPHAIYTCSKATFDSFWKGPVAMVSAKTAKALNKPDGDSVLTQDLAQGTVLPISGTEGKWTSVRIPGGQDAWVETSKVKEFNSRTSVFSEKKGAEAVIATAKQYVGLPYLWGGTTAYGFDCSGLVQFAFHMNGYQLRRDADMQFEQGIAVTDRKDLLPGDLVFFQTYRQGASHVGIYVGNSRYIQAGSSGLSILSFNPADPDYSASLDKAYLGARRVIKQ